MKNTDQYILTLSCKDTFGIVAAVAGFLAENGGFIMESAQFGDDSTGRFFMRTHFSMGNGGSTQKKIKDLFSPIAVKFGMEWEIHDVSYKPKVLILVSKAGHCLNYLLHRQLTGNLAMNVAAIASNHEIFREMAGWYKVPFYHLPIVDETKQDQELKIWKLIKEFDVDVVVLARYMQILSADLCEKLRGRAINIHHSFLPSFKGAEPYKQAYDRGVKIIGATAHYVTTNLDEGPIIEQEVIRVDHTHKPDDLKAMGEDMESMVLARALKYHTEHRVLLNNKKTVVFK